MVRPLRPDDAALYPVFDAALTEEDRRFRFFTGSPNISASQVHRLVAFDRRTARAFIAIDPDTGVMLGVGRLHGMGPGLGEFAVVVRSDLKGCGLGRALMAEVDEAAASLSILSMVGYVLRDNAGMLAFCRSLGFMFENAPGDASIVLARRDL